MLSLRPALLCALSVFAAVCLNPVVSAQTEDDFTRQDRLRGSITPEREWWDLKQYQLAVDFFPEEKTIAGSNVITFETLKEGRRMQLDLQEPLAITSVEHNGTEPAFEREGNVYWIDFVEPLPAGQEYQLTVHYEGTPVESRNPPWEGGVSWQEDEKGNPFIATSCQGIGASIWWPCKDHGYDEPDRGMKISVSVPSGLTAVSNGRHTATRVDEETRRTTFDWLVESPINNYCVNVNIGNYVNFSETYDGEAGPLDMDYWVLDHDRERAAVQFKEAPRTIAAFEHWFGPYPFYRDSYKLVQVPYLGMEHQSSVTYGNGFQNGYRGTDLSATGVGMKFDFIIVHETGHEWFGNNISMKDAADMWIHESFTNYSENLFVEYHFSEQEAQDYVIGCRKRVSNDRPIIGVYNVNNEGSGDMYYKGGNMLHTLRHVIDDTEKWRSILRGMNEEFRLKTIGTADIETYISRQSGIDFGLFFDQYLRDTRIPVLKYSEVKDGMSYWFENVVDGFSYPAVLTINGEVFRVTPTKEPQILAIDGTLESVELDRNFYYELEKQQARSEQESEDGSSR